MNRRAVALAVLLAVLLPALPLVVAPSAPARAQAVAAAPARVSLSAIDPVVASGGEAAWALVVEHVGDVPWDTVEVVADLHAALGSRSALRAALADGAVPARLRREVVPATTPGPLAPGAVVRIAGTFTLTGGALSRGDTAVHPLRLSVLADGIEVGRLATAVVRVGAAPTVPLATTLAWPLSAPPAHGPDGRADPALDVLTAAGGRLDTLVAAPGASLVTAADGTEQPVLSAGAAAFADGLALSAPAHLVEDLALRATDVATASDAATTDAAALRAQDLLGDVRLLARALPGAPLVTPYGDADLGRLLASGPALRPLAARAVLEGAGRTRALLGRDASPVVLLDAPVAPGVLDLLPGRTVLLPYAAIEGPDLALDVPLDEPVRSLRSPTGRLVTALVGDPYLTAALGASTRTLPADPVLAAHEVLVRTAMVHLEAPGREGRTLVLLPPPDFDPDPRFAAELLARLGRAPWLVPTAPDALADGVARPLPPATLADGPDGPVGSLPSRLATALVRTERDLALLAGAVDPAAGLPDDVVPVGGRALRDAADELLRAASRAFATDVDRAVALLDGVRSGVDEAFGTFAIAVTDVTLTDREGTVPITLTRTGAVPLRVRIEVTGPAALTWTDGRIREVTLDVDAERSLEVPVRAGATGRFPVTVRVTDPSGDRLLAEEVVGLRATVLAGPALALIAAIVLVLTVVGTLRQRRRGLAWRTVTGPDGTGAR